MTKSCVDLLPRRSAAACAALLMLAWAAPAARAQEAERPAAGAPVSLIPPSPAAGATVPQARPQVPAPGYRVEAPQPQPAPSTERAIKGGISIDTLGELDANAVGVLDSRSGGLGIDMWKGTSAALVDRLLARLDGASALPTAQALARRLLLTAARSPEGADKGSGSSLLAKRLGHLLSAGDVASANALLRVVPAHAEDGGVGVARLNTALLTNDRAAACATARDVAGKETGAVWRQTLVFCQYGSGEGAKAAIGLGLLREQGIKDDAFFSLAAILGGAKEERFQAPAKLTPLHLAMMRAAGVEISETLVQTADVALLRAIAFSPNAGLDTRLDAAEQAEAAGALEVEKLRQMYTGVTFAPGDVQGAVVGAEKLAGPRGRALLYQAARGAADPGARARLLAKAFALARAQGRLGTAVRAFQPQLEEMPQTEDLAWFAADAARALYAAGGADVAAARWAEIAINRPQVPPGGGVSTDVAVWPLVAIARIPARPRPAPVPVAAAPRPSASPGEQGGQAPLAGSVGPGTAPPLDFGAVGAGSARVMPPEGGPTAADALAGVRRVAPQPVVEVVTNRSDAAPPPQPGQAVQAPPPPPSPFEDIMFDRWRKTQAGLAGPEAAQKRAALLLSLLDGLGAAVPQEAWIESSGAVREMAALPPPGLIAALEQAAAQNRVGETVLLALAVLGGDGPEKLHPSVAGTVVRALAAAGFGSEARALALEVAFGAGL
ncbi:MAG: hypothetical protein OEO83_05935 [Alphaproteobacteria bacterium]|nr:hypothetical protein [Alphaproteobacteria bacterium]